MITKFAFYEGQLKEINVLCTRTAVKELASAHLSWSETLKATKNQLSGGILWRHALLKFHPNKMFWVFSVCFLF